MSGAAPHAQASRHWGLLIIVSATLMLTMGARQTSGLFVEPIHRSSGVGIAAISFALAVGQCMWGAVQPVFGAIADQRGPLQVLWLGGVLLLVPPTPLTVYLFAAALGFAWLATVPPTAGLLGKLFGPRYLGTLFGLTLLSHQIGGFFGAWLGGVALERFGNYQWMWYADMAAAAALVNPPIREQRPLAARPA